MTWPFTSKSAREKTSNDCLLWDRKKLPFHIVLLTTLPIKEMIRWIEEKLHGLNPFWMIPVSPMLCISYFCCVFQICALERARAKGTPQGHYGYHYELPQHCVCLYGGCVWGQLLPSLLGSNCAHKVSTTCNYLHGWERLMVLISKNGFNKAYLKMP